MQHGDGGSVSLETLRQELDRIDQVLVDVLAERVRVAERVGSVKATAGALPWEPGREAEIVRRAVTAARAAGIPEEGVRHVFWSVLEYCRDVVAASARRAGAVKA